MKSNEFLEELFKKINKYEAGHMFANLRFKEGGKNSILFSDEEKGVNFKIVGESNNVYLKMWLYHGKNEIAKRYTKNFFEQLNDVYFIYDDCNANKSSGGRNNQKDNLLILNNSDYKETIHNERKYNIKIFSFKGTEFDEKIENIIVALYNWAKIWTIKNKKINSNEPDVKSDIEYYLLGAYWDDKEPKDQTAQFVKNGLWENKVKNSYDRVKEIAPGSKVAIKSVYTRAKTNSTMGIKARGVVTENLNDGKFLKIEWEKGFKPFEVDFTGGYWKTLVEVKNEEHINKIWNKQDNSRTPSNIILYGPPGTGKTYRTIDMAEKIIINDDYMSALECDEVKHKENTREFNKKLHKQIHFITFHQNYSYEEFVGGLRPDAESETLKFKWAPGIFLKACAEAYKQTGIQHPLNEMDKANDIDNFLLYCEYPINPEKFKEAPKVVLIIDEINRANISRVFGELITLIEDDKRIGGEHQLILSLPNGRKFGVPANLVIIGTMNTADKSIALLDIALRRRFEFVQMEVKPDLAKPYSDLLSAINKEIEKKKGNQDFNIGHSYFMKMEESIGDIMNKKVIPLLYEYFMGNKEEVVEVLSSSCNLEHASKDDYSVVKFQSVKL